MGNIKQPTIQGVDSRINMRFFKIEQFLNELASTQGTSTEVVGESKEVTTDQYTYRSFIPLGENVQGSPNIVDENGNPIDITETSKINKTDAKITVPNSYYLDLKVLNSSSTIAIVTADYLTVHNADGKTIGLGSISETITISGAAGFRYLFIEYNATTDDVKLCTGTSPTAPTLDAGYTYYMYVGSRKWDGVALVAMWQYNDYMFTTPTAIKQDTHSAVADTKETIDISSFVPVGTKIIIVTAGLTSTSIAGRAMGVGSGVAATDVFYSFSLPAVTKVTGYSMGSGYTCQFPLTTAQQMAWVTSDLQNLYGIVLTAFIDDI